MANSGTKHQDLRAAIVKAGVPRAADIPTQKVHRRKKERATDSKPGKGPAAGAEATNKRIAKLSAELREAKSQRTDLESKVKTLAERAKSERLQIDRTQRRLKHLEDVIAKVRRSLGAGKDAKADDMPGRISSLSTRASALESELHEARGRESDLRNQIESLSQHLANKDEEIRRLRLADSLHVTEVGEEASVDTRGNISTPAAAFCSPSDSEHSDTEEVVPTFFSRVGVSESHDNVKARYAAWVLGLREYSGARKNRVRDGVDVVWGLKDILHEPNVDLEGPNGTKITIRTIDEKWFIRFIHKDSSFEGNEWWNLARLVPDAAGTTVEHAMIRFTGALARRPNAVAIPRVLKDLMRTSTRQYVWEDFTGEPKEVTAVNASLFVEDILMSSQREVPVVVVSRSAQGIFTVDPFDLAKALDGLAVVFTTVAGPAFMLSEAFRSAGIDPRLLGCFDGGVRMYMPEFGPNSDPYRHTLWIRSFLEGKTPIDRVRLITRKVAAYSVGLRVPPGFARTIEDFDLRLAAEQAAKLQTPGETTAQVKALVAQVNGLHEVLERLRNEVDQIQPLRIQLAQSKDHADYLVEMNQIMEEEVSRNKDERDGLLRRIHNLRVNYDQLEAMNKEAQSAKVFLGSDLIDGLLQDSWSPIGAYVRLLQARYSERVVFLPEALNSADECTFEMVEKAKLFLRRLVVDYYDILACGKGSDQEAARLFGKDGFASKEGKSLSSEGVRARTWNYEGEDFFMESHLKMTHSFERNTSNRVFRTHFFWDGRREKLLIGHIGRHLPP